MSELDIFTAAVEKIDPAERSAYLDQACAGDAALRQRVEVLLRTYGKAGDFLARPAVVQLLSTSPQTLDGTEHEKFAAAKRDQSDPSEASAATAADKDDIRDFFEPSTKPGSLGRLSHYEVMEIIGCGGFGTVVKAFDERLHRLVAIKIMSPLLASTSPARKRFLREARSSAAIRHENVVNIHAIEEEPIPFLVMEYVEGETLQQRLDRLGPLDSSETLRIGAQIANGLAAAHAMGRVHRDIKPANILLENGVDRVKLTDFGLARAADDASLTQSGIIAGTPMYMAPEQAQGMAVDQRADLFSLGSVLYVMCSGRPPFRASTTLAVLKRVAEDTPRPIREIIPEVPQWLCDIVSRLHAKNADDRFASAQEVAVLLERCLAELQMHGKVQQAVEANRGTGFKSVLQASAPPVRPSRRRLAALLAVFAMTLLGLALTEAAGVTNFVRGTVIRLFSPNGTLVVEVDDPDVSVSIDGEELIIKGAGTKEIRMKPGQYQVQTSKHGNILRQELVTVTQNGRQVVRISRENMPSANLDPDRKVAEWALSIGGIVTVDDGNERVVKLAQDLPAGPYTLRKIDLNGNASVDDSALSKLTALKKLQGLGLESTQVTDMGLKQIATHQSLETLHLRWTKVTDGGLKELAGLRGLDILHVGGTQVTDAGLKELVGLTRLRSITLSQTQVTDAGLKELTVLKNLQGVNLGGTKVTDAGVKELASIKRLRELILDSTEVTDEGVKELASHTNLTKLFLPKQITDTGLKEVAQIKTLRWLSLRHTQVSDAGLMHLHALDNLTTLNLTETAVTAQGIAPLQKALPGCQIASDVTPKGSP